MTSSGTRSLDQCAGDALNAIVAINRKSQKFRGLKPDVRAAVDRVLARLRKACGHARRLLLHFHLAHIRVSNESTRQTLRTWARQVHGLVVKVSRKLNEIKVKIGSHKHYNASKAKTFCSELQAAILKGVIVLGLISYAIDELSNHLILYSCFNQKANYFFDIENDRIRSFVTLHFISLK